MPWKKLSSLSPQENSLQIQDRLKSFVLRKGRITSNQKRAIDTLWDKYILDSNKEVKNIYPDTDPILDIGFGAGETTSFIAKAKPDTFEPSKFKKTDNQPPLNPVCPVIRIFLFFQNFLFIFF